jgi:hypothetical protein
MIQYLSRVIGQAEFHYYPFILWIEDQTFELDAQCINVPKLCGIDERGMQYWNCDYVMNRTMWDGQQDLECWQEH